MRELYLDNSATTAVTKEVLNEMLPYFTEGFYNPSAQYAGSREVRQAIKTARAEFARAIHAKPEQVFFTSGATESNNIIARNYYVISSIYEHPSMQTGAQVKDEKEFKAELKKIKYHHTGTFPEVLSWQMVNSETGMEFPIKEIAQLAHMNGLLCHSDMTAAFGKTPIDVEYLDIDFASFSGHKFHAPKGIGVLYIKEPDKFKSDIIGGGQEKKIRSGTENVAGIVGIGTAARLYAYNPTHNSWAKQARLYVLSRLRTSMPCDFKVLEHENSNYQVPSILNIAIKGVEGESLMILLDGKGICVSTGSACHSASLEVSQTVKSFNLPPEYEHGTIRISFDDSFDSDDADYLVDEIVNNCKALLTLKGEI